MLWPRVKEALEWPRRPRQQLFVDDNFRMRLDLLAVDHFLVVKEEEEEEEDQAPK